MSVSLAEEVVRAYSKENYRGVCPEKREYKAGTRYSVPLAIRALVALWYRKRSLAFSRSKRKCSFIYKLEAQALEVLVYNWLRTHYGLTRSQSICMSTRWRFVASRT